METQPPRNARVLIDAQLNVELAPTVEVGIVPQESATPTLSGRVSNERTGVSIQGLTITAVPEADGGRVPPIGSATSGADGRFSIRFDDAPETAARLAALRNVPTARLRLRVSEGNGPVLFTSDPIALDRQSVVVDLNLPAPARPASAKLWSVLGTHLTQTRVARLSDLVQLLSSDQPIGSSRTTAAFTPVSRAAMLDQLERAFLDPQDLLQKAAGSVPSLLQLQDPEAARAYASRVRGGRLSKQTAAALNDMLGKAASFATLFEVDWLIDPSSLVDGQIGAALDRFSDKYKAWPIGDFQRTTGPANYRDYLLAIWLKYAPKIVYAPSLQLTPAQALDQLQTRFHQTFTTYDDALRSANSVLIPILSAILQAPTGKTFGFGVPAASIPPQGTLAPRAYLDKLIALGGVSAEELGLRYRLDFTRADTAMSSPVQENIATLQGFYRDGFQSDPEPSHIDPDVLGQPIVPDQWWGKAPFFLYYDEWLRQQDPFYAENFIDVRRVLIIDLAADARTRLDNLAGGKVSGQAANIPAWKFCQHVLAVWDKLQEGHGFYFKGEFQAARDKYLEARDLANSAMQDNVLQTLAMAAFYNKRKAVPLKSMKDLANFMNPAPEFNAGGFGYGDTPDWARDRMGLRLAYYALFTIPVCLGDAYFALGDYEHAIFYYGQATRFEVTVARESDSAGYRQVYTGDFQMYWRGDRPYSAALHDDGARTGSSYPNDENPPQYDDFYDTTPQNAVEQYAFTWARRIPVLAELRLFRIRQANAMLEWADALYRLNDPTSAARARELYKDALWVHGKVPPISPSWPGGLLWPPGFFHQTENPAISAQATRSNKGIYQIDHGLNYYGERNDIVPVLRYRPLKDAADRFAALARTAQLDFLAYTDRIEATIVSNLQLSNFLQKAQLQSNIADELQAIAQHDVVVAQDQVAAVQAAIKAKEDEIAKHDSLFGQIGDAISGVKSIVSGIPDDTKSAVTAGVVSEATGKELVGEGMLGLGAGASVMTGFGIFAAVGYITLSGMADAATQRQSDLRTLMDKALPAAQAAVEARKHGVNVTSYQKQIAQADIALAQSLIFFEQKKTLNLNFWLQLAQLSRRLLRRYLEIGARLSWLAERALAYEQDRELHIVRMDYFPAPLQGVTGPDLMMADLTELEATRIEGMKRTVPVRRTISLARDFPMQYGQLKASGQCGFRTKESFFGRAHPGTFAYRVRAVSAVVQQRDFEQPLRGSLINRGISISKPGQPGEHLLVRPADALPLSEFRLEQNMALYGLPNETLLTFEGSNAETFWEIGMPKAANPAGLESLVDVLLTFDLFCEYGQERYAADVAALSTTDRKWVLMSAARYQAAAMTALTGGAAIADIVYDLRALRLLPRQEKTRKITNIAAISVTPDDLSFKAKLSAATPATSAPVDFTHNFVISSLQPDPAMPVLPASPLNVFAGLDPNQAFTLEVKKAANPGIDFTRVTDVILAIEYEASLV
ncbi:MAG TPA: hypothetical protein VH458_14440 [Vicinamibacterales bacterium]|jgi:tetratricopeptide (TPR) repeat protein